MKFKLDLKILFFLALFFLTNQLKIYILIMLFCFIHECAHIIVAMMLGFKVEQVELMPFGFFCDLRANIKDYNEKVLNSNIAELKKIFIVMAGPLVNIILAVIFIVIYWDFKWENILWLIYCNLVIFIFNLIPIFPLDGGRAIKSFFKIIIGSQKANKYVNLISNVTVIIFTFVSSILILYLKNIAILFILLYLWYLVILENRKYFLMRCIKRSIEI